MNLREHLKINWEILSGKQKIILGCLLALIICFAFGGWISSVKTYFEVRALEKQVKTAKAEADAVLKRAAQIAGKLVKERTELKKLEEKRDVKKTELETAEKQASDSLDDVNRARLQPRTDDVSAEQLCSELAGLGYPCR